MPGALKVAVQEPLDMDDPKRLVALVAERAARFQQWMPMAMGNLEIAQYRDTLRYAHTRSGAWKPKAISYGVGDYVYLQREMLDTLKTKVGQRILRLRTVRPEGVLELEGADARTVRMLMERCAPCHRPDMTSRWTRSWRCPLETLRARGAGRPVAKEACCCATAAGPVGTWGAWPSP
jgi:hypothetical protein